MKPSNPPPLSGKFLSGRICSRDMDWPNGKACGKEPFLHVAWWLDGGGCEAGFVCEGHAAELGRRNWIPVQQHELGAGCGMPNAVWDFEENRCYVPEESEPHAIETRTPAEIPA